MNDEPSSSDAQWMRSVVEAHAADLGRYAASILGDADLAKDAVQDSFIRLWQEPRERVADHVRPWLFRVCRNRALDLRRKGGRVKPLDEATRASEAAEGPGPGQLAERRDSHEHVLQLMRDLPENQREVVRLKFQNGLSYKEIASVTDLTVTNVGFLLHTALQTLRSRIAATGE